MEFFATIYDAFVWLIGVDKQIQHLTLVQIVGKRRFLGGFSAFDILMGFVIGSILSRTITGGETVINATAVILTLMLIHYSIAYVTYYHSEYSSLFKSSERRLICDGVVDEEAMRISKLGVNDLLQCIRQQAGVETAEEVKSAYLERDGSITIIPKEREPQIVDIEVEDGVQRVVVSLG